jgi:hypothetical protein
MAYLVISQALPYRRLFYLLFELKSWHHLRCTRPLLRKLVTFHHPIQTKNIEILTCKQQAH